MEFHTVEAGFPLAHQDPRLVICSRKLLDYILSSNASPSIRDHFSWRGRCRQWGASNPETERGGDGRGPSSTPDLQSLVDSRGQTCGAGTSGTSQPSLVPRASLVTSGICGCIYQAHASSLLTSRANV